VRLALLLTPVAVMVVMTQVANALWADLVNTAPELLIALSSRNAFLVAVVGRISYWSYYLIGTVRLIAPDPFLFALGWFYGQAAIRWMEHRTPTFGKMMRTFEGWFVRFGHALVVVFPNNYVCVIAGAARMSPWVFGALNLVGTVGRLLVLAVVGDVFAAPIDWLLDLVARFRIPLLVVSILLVALTAGAELKRGGKELDALRELEEEGRSDGQGHDDERA
jgi:membrane protein DedA with SNARE-associated domain